MNKNEIKTTVEALVKAEGAQSQTVDKPEAEITSKFVKECLWANEMGDGMLYAAINKKNFVYNKTSCEWLKWQGHHWILDDMDEAISAVESVALRYLQEAKEIVSQIGEASAKDEKEAVKTLQKTQQNIYKRVQRLRKDSGRTNCIKFAHTNPKNSLAVQGEKIDQNVWLLGCANGVIDLRTGEFRNGRQNDYVFKSSPVSWDGLDAPAKTWEKTLLDTHNKKQAVVSYLARLFGYAITGLDIENIFVVFSGVGRNGKGVMVKKIMQVTGDLAAPIQSEMLLDQGRSNSSSGPTPDIMALNGLRMAFASETDEGRKFSSARVKLFTGGDKLTGRNPHDKRPTSFDPTHTLFLLTNHEPQAPGDDFAFWERMQLTPFFLSFVDGEPQEENHRPRDKNLFEKLKNEDAGILAWIVRGCLEWQKTGLLPPPVVVDATRAYKKREDLVGEFLNEYCYVDPDVEVGASFLYEKFSEWWENNISPRSPSQKKFGKWMARRKINKKKVGTYKYLGIGLIDE